MVKLTDYLQLNNFAAKFMDIQALKKTLKESIETSPLILENRREALLTQLEAVTDLATLEKMQETLQSAPQKLETGLAKLVEKSPEAAGELSEFLHHKEAQLRKAEEHDDHQKDLTEAESLLKNLD